MSKQADKKKKQWEFPKLILLADITIREAAICYINFRLYNKPEIKVTENSIAEAISKYFSQEEIDEFLKNSKLFYRGIYNPEHYRGVTSREPIEELEIPSRDSIGSLKVLDSVSKGSYEVTKVTKVNEVNISSDKKDWLGKQVEW